MIEGATWLDIFQRYLNLQCSFSLSVTLSLSLSFFSSLISFDFEYQLIKLNAPLLFAWSLGNEIYLWEKNIS